MKSNLLCALMGLLITTTAISQKIDYPTDFLQLLKKTNVEFFEPLDAGYRDFEPVENEFQNVHFAIHSRKEDLDIRYYIVPWDEHNPSTTNPHLRTFAALTNVATNADEAIISAIQPTKEMMQKDFNADWGMTYFFTPKKRFSDKPHCRMLALCKEGQGTVFVFYLFDDTGNEALDTRYLALRFM